MSENQTSLDHLLDGRVVLRQPKQGYRAGSDPVFLAAGTAARAGQSVLDLGCGVGAASLCLLARIPGLSVTGLELQPALAALAGENAAANGFADSFAVVQGCLAGMPDDLKRRSFDHVITNPPWYGQGTASHPPVESKRIGHMEDVLDLAGWLAEAVKRIRPRGHLTVVHRADRVGDILVALTALKMGAVRIYPLWPRAGAAATRIVVTARKDVRTPTTLSSGLVLHAESGEYTAAAQSVLRDACSLPGQE
jgi:tRNA1(Val) A37 N6-methylase TrmN6